MIAVKPVVQPISGEGIRLRLLTENDLPLTLAWRNRDAARSQFRHAEKLVPAEHRAWFDQQKKLNDRYYFMVENAEGAGYDLIRGCRAQVSRCRAEPARRDILRS